jgi:hypothetical protein
MCLAIVRTWQRNTAQHNTKESSMFKAIAKVVKAIKTHLVGYRVRVIGGAFDGATHYAGSYQEALAWAACYKPQHRYCVHVRRCLTLELVGRIA